MLLIENIVVRWQEWRDRQEEEPDLVPRLRKVWTAPRVPQLRQVSTRTPATLGSRPALHARPGM